VHRVPVYLAAKAGGHTHLYVGKNYNGYRFEQQNVANSCTGLAVPLAVSACVNRDKHKKDQ